MRVESNGSTHTGFDLSGYGSMPVVCDRGQPDIAAGTTTALGVWQDTCGIAGGIDILGRMIGFRANMPLLMR
jgi:hypothetical protein